MKENKLTKVVQNIWGVLMIFLAKLVVPMPTTNRWLTKMGETTNNLSNYGLEDLQNHKLSRSLSLISLI
ncbi:MAG: hypothetical protein CMH63_00165 [Nanoarchaeota archaeon]|jgi:hypothetical protein|nr:hypothetical protein [Nanoarchaeota archaeon]|tara:strand:+ start:41480 stop:41686 length:207 start_codon:yes stop_codon:yes gene_type:complete